MLDNVKAKVALNSPTSQVFMPLRSGDCVRESYMSGQARTSGIRRDQPRQFGFERIIDDISSLNWTEIGEEDLISVAWVYYFFSVQFRECLESACTLYPQ